MINRRQFLQYSSLATFSLTGFTQVIASSSKINEFEIVAKESRHVFVDDIPTLTNRYDAGQDSFFPVLRVKQGDTLRATIKNQLTEATTVHWHGIRLPNAMDGVPHLTQKPIESGDVFTYEFSCPDAGLFWFHSHLASTRQIANGLVGVLIVEEPEALDFSRDFIWVYKDWFVKEPADFIKALNRQDDVNLLKHSNAGKQGTYGDFASVNLQSEVKEQAPEHSWVRLGLFNVDISRLMRIHAYGVKDVKILGVDGNALAQPEELHRRLLTPAQRLDLAIQMPEAGKAVELKNVFLKNPKRLGTIQAVKSSQRKGLSDCPRLKVNPIATPDLENAVELSFQFLAAGALSPENNPTFWSINKRSMTELDHSAHVKLPPPLAVLQHGKTYLLTLQNTTPHTHPIHLHGHTFLVIESSKRKIKPFHTDVVNLTTKEKIKVAFVADNLGKWMFHCHIIEHAVSGMMGYVEVR